MNPSHIAILAAMCVAAAALTASAAWADSHDAAYSVDASPCASQEECLAILDEYLLAAAERQPDVEDPHAAVSASWSDDEKNIGVVIINSHMPADNPRLDMETAKGYRISLSGDLTPFEVKSIRNGSPWELGSTVIVAGDTVYKVTALHNKPPRVEDVGMHVGIVWENGLPYALTFNFEDDGPGDTAWNITDNMSPVEHSYELVDAEWGPFPGYAHLYLDDVRHAVVYAIYDNSKFLVNTPPETASDSHTYNEPFDRPVLTKIGNHDVNMGGYVVAKGNGERLDVEYNNTHYHFHGKDGIAVVSDWNVWEPTSWWIDFYDSNPTDAEIEEQRQAAEEVIPLYNAQSYTASGSPMTVISIDGQNYAVVATVDGPPVLVDAAGAAALGLGDIRYMTPEDYMRWELPADAPPSEGTIMKVSGLRSAHGGGDRTFFGFGVRNVHHEPLEIYIDRAAAAGHSLYHADVVVEQSHPYSSFDAPPGYGAIRLSGEYLGGHFGPSKAYPKGDIPYEKPLGYGHYDTGVHRDVYTVYSNEDLKRVFAYVETWDVIRLEPGQSRSIGIVLHSPCLYREDSKIWTEGACGIGGPSLDKYNLEFNHIELVLVADGHPEWAVSAQLEQECTRTAGMTVNCVKWETVEYETKVVHIDDVCEGARCDSRP